MKFGRWLTLICCVAVLASGCVKSPVHAPVVTATRSTAVQVEELRELPTPQMDIIDLQELVTADKTQVILTGTIINRGDGATSRLNVLVHALDAQGRDVITMGAVPSTNTIPGKGGMATFTATLENRPEVTRYHVEAVAR